MSRNNKYTSAQASEQGIDRFNRISKPTNALFSSVFILIALFSVIPFLLVIVISFTDQSAIRANGYQFIPSKFSLQAYKSLFQNADTLAYSFFISFIVTISGTVLGVLLNAVMGYALSRQNFRLRKAYTMLIFIPMLFNGGLVASFLVNTQVLHLKDTLWALILPIACNSFYIIVFRTFFTATVPDSLIEAGKVDGASQLRLFFQVVVPISLPALATVGLFLCFSYWNDWQNALLYVSGSPRLWPAQYTLIGIEKDIMFLANNPELSGMGREELLRNLPQDSIRMALVVLTVLPITLAYPFFQKYFVSGLTVGAVKG